MGEREQWNKLEWLLKLNNSSAQDFRTDCVPYPSRPFSEYANPPLPLEAQPNSYL